MRKADKVIITCAITGSIHTPSMSPYLPVTPEEIAEQAVAAAEAGAAMLHLHARDPDDGHPVQSTEMFRRFMPHIKEQTDAILNVTTGGGLGMTLEERLAPALDLAPEVASMNMGSMNFNIAGAGERVQHFKHAWEKPYLDGTRDLFIHNTFAQIEYGMKAMGERGTRFEFECYDVGHLYSLAHFVDRGIVSGPLFIQCIFGVLGGIGTDLENLLHMRATADRLFGDNYYLSVLAAGRQQMPFVTMSAILGGNVRVGLEDSLFIGKGELARTNADQVAKIRRILKELGLEIATPAEARTMLGTKGMNDVRF